MKKREHWSIVMLAWGGKKGEGEKGGILFYFGFWFFIDDNCFSFFFFK